MTLGLRSDGKVLKKFRAGDASVLEHVYRAYVDSVTASLDGALRRYGATAEGGRRMLTAELPPLVQEVFTWAFAPRTRRRFRGLRDFGPGLTVIVRATVIAHLRRTGRLFGVDPILSIDPVSLHPSPRESARGLDDLQLVAQVTRYVAGLPPELRRARELLYIHGLSQREAADALGVDRETVRALTSRLREGLRDALAHATRPDVAIPELAPQR